MIFCVEDDSSIRELMVYTIQASGMEAMGFADGNSFWKELENVKPELVILDIMLPGEDGISILKKLRASVETEQIPVIMATAKGSEFDKVAGLDAGADDYLAKPYGMLEMVSRINAVLRRAKPHIQGQFLSSGSITMDNHSHEVYASGRKVLLTLKEYELLKLLLESPGKAFSRSQLLQEVWGIDYIGETRTVDVHVGTLRTKLGMSGDKIETVRGIGYRLGEEL